MRTLIGHICFLLILWAMVAAPVGAAIFVVNTTDDIINGGDGQLSLREAVIDSNNNFGPDTIVLTNGDYVLSIPGNSEETSVTGDLDFNDPSGETTLQGSGSSVSFISGTGDDRIVDVRGSATVTVHGVTIQFGQAPNGQHQNAVQLPTSGSHGGGIRNLSTLSLFDCVVTENAAGDGGSAINGTNGVSGGFGGGIYSLGSKTLTLVNCLVENNRAGDGGNGGGGDSTGTGDGGNGASGGRGGGVYANTGFAATGTTFRANRAGKGGNGGVPSQSAGLEGADGGSAGGGGSGGGLYLLGASRIYNCTIDSNGAGDSGVARPGTEGEPSAMAPGGSGGAGGIGGSGGGIYVDENLTIEYSTVSSNFTGTGGNGGNGAPGTDDPVLGGTDGGNGGTGGFGGSGGGINRLGGELTIFQCTIGGNWTGNGGNGGHAGSGGEGSEVMPDDLAEKGDSDGEEPGITTIGGTPGGNAGTAGNGRNGGSGGGVNFGSTPGVASMVNHATIAFNSAGSGGTGGSGASGGLGDPPGANSGPGSNGNGGTGGGTATGSGTPTFGHTLIASNRVTGSSPDCQGGYNSLGYNFIGDPAFCQLTNDLTGNLSSLDAHIDQLADNGGPTQTHFLQPASPAREAGDPGYAGPPFGDQRISFTRVEFGRVDIGALEVSDGNDDNDNDTLPDPWEVENGLDPNDDGAGDPDNGPGGNPDGDPFNNDEEYVADTDPNDPDSQFALTDIAVNSPAVVVVPSSTGRVYTLRFTDLIVTGMWNDVAGQVDVPGNGGLLTMQDTTEGTNRFYHIRVKLP